MTTEQILGSRCRSHVVGRGATIAIVVCAAALALGGCDDGSSSTSDAGADAAVAATADGPAQATADAGNDATQLGCERPAPECLTDYQCGQPCCFAGVYDRRCGSAGDAKTILCDSGVWRVYTTWDEMSCVPPGARP